MLDNITPFNALIAEANEVQQFLDESVSEKLEDVLERGDILSGIIARTGKMVADAEYHLDSFRKSEIMDILRNTGKQQLPALVMKQLVESACKDYNYLSKRCDRLNRTATHQLEWLRTVVSNAKSEREASKGFNNRRREDIF